MSDTLVEVTCPRCGHKWTVDIADPDEVDQVGYKGPKRQTRMESYRAQCPKDGTYVVIDVEAEEE